MKGTNLDSDELAQISTSLDSLRKHLEGDLTSVRQLPESQIARVLRMQSLSSHARADALLRRLVELREIIDRRRRTLERLRAWVWQIRGGVKPH
jgi:hypothetical protein